MRYCDFNDNDPFLQLNVGASWDSPEGRRTIVQVATMPDGSIRYVVETGTRTSRELIHPQNIDAEVDRDTKNVMYRANVRETEAKERAALAAEQQHLSEFLTSTRSSLDQGRAKTALTKYVSWSSQGAPRHKQIENRVARGWTVQTNRRGEREFISPDGAFFTEKDTSKIGMDYAAFLSGRGR